MTRSIRLAATALVVYFGLLALLPLVGLALLLGFVAAFGLGSGAASLFGGLVLGNDAGLRAAAQMLGTGAAAFVAMCFLFNAVAAAWSKLRGPRDAPFAEPGRALRLAR